MQWKSPGKPILSDLVLDRVEQRTLARRIVSKQTSSRSPFFRTFPYCSDLGQPGQYVVYVQVQHDFISEWFALQQQEGDYVTLDTTDPNIAAIRGLAPGPTGLGVAVAQPSVPLPLVTYCPPR